MDVMQEADQASEGGDTLASPVRSTNALLVKVANKVLKYGKSAQK